MYDRSALAAPIASVAALRTCCGVAYTSDLVIPFSSSSVDALTNLHPAFAAPHIAIATGSPARRCQLGYLPAISAAASL
jgi:hypothetical protein